MTILAALFVASTNAALSASTTFAHDLVAGDGTAEDDSAYALEPRSTTLPWLAELDRLFETEPFDPELAATSLEDSGDVETIRLRPRPKPGPFSMNLYNDGEFLSQQTTYWCIPASTQLMMNIMDKGRPNRSRSFQARLYRVGDDLEEDGTRDREEDEFWDRDEFRGMGISEWVGLLNRFDYGPYELGGAKTRQNALQKAARLMRKTGKPVGLVVWRGAHAWVMSGFTATADPALGKDFRVTSVWVHDPWYPRVSSIWGRSRPPNAKVSALTLGQDYLPYDRPYRRHPDRDGRFMLVLPQLAPGTRVV